MSCRQSGALPGEQDQDDGRADEVDHDGDEDGVPQESDLQDAQDRTTANVAPPATQHARSS